MSREISVVKKPANNGNKYSSISTDSDNGSSSVSMDRASSVEDNYFPNQVESIIPVCAGLQSYEAAKTSCDVSWCCDVTNNVEAVPQVVQVEPECKDETDTSTAVAEADTSATLTAPANIPESFKMVDDAPNIEEVLLTKTRQYLATKPPVLPETSTDAVNSIASDEGNVQPSADSIEVDECEVTTPSEVQDQLYVVGNQVPALPDVTTLTDKLCTGMEKIKGKEPSGKDVEESTGVLVVWVNPQSCLNSVYSEDTTTTLPRLDEPLGKGGNGQVVKCYIDAVVNNKVAVFACKIEKKKPLVRNSKMFKRMCQLTDEKCFVVIHAYLKEECPNSKDCPYGYVGYLIMEYFPLGNVSSVLEELVSILDKCDDEIKKLDEQKMQSQNDEDFGKHRINWQTAIKMKIKVDQWCTHLFYGIINSLKALHDKNLVHLDIKDYNILLRKTCEHKNKFLCECDTPPFDVLIGDYDYCHEVDDPIPHPKSVGTRQFQTFSMRCTNLQCAKTALDLFGLLVTIIRIRSKMGHKNKNCIEVLRQLDANIFTCGELNYKLSKLFANTKETLKSLESKSHVTLGCEQCEMSKAGLTSLDGHFDLQKDVISEVSRKWWEQSIFNFVRFLKDTFSDTDDQLLKHLLWMLNEILQDYEATFVEESTTQQDL